MGYLAKLLDLRGIWWHIKHCGIIFLVSPRSFSSLNYTIRHALISKTVNFEPIPIASNF